MKTINYSLGAPAPLHPAEPISSSQNSTLSWSIGARLDLGQVGYYYDRFARAAKKVVVDIDTAEIKKMTDRKMKIDVPVVSDAGSFHCPDSQL